MRWLSEVVADFSEYDKKFVERAYRDLMSQPKVWLQEIAKGNNPVEAAQAEVLKVQDWSFKHDVLEDPFFKEELPFSAPLDSPAPSTPSSGPPVPAVDLLPF